MYRYTQFLQQSKYGYHHPHFIDGKTETSLTTLGQEKQLINGLVGI